MSGIAGWVGFNRDIEKDMDVVHKMTSTLAKRGPDATNYWADRHVGFGHQRLAIIDSAGGKQPMVRFKNRQQYVICYNGELYNTEDIRKQLLTKGYQFEGYSDTEVLLTAYMEWKEDCLQHLNGIFAFAIWDSDLERVFVARDRLGVKPLFYSEQNNSLLFASEIKAILAHEESQAIIDTTGLAELLGFGPSRLPGSGVFKNIKELRPAHYFIYSRKGLTIKRYWQLTSQSHHDSYEETVQKVRFLLEDAVKRQLSSDVPLCTFLSGGIDSSAISAIAATAFQKTGKGSLHTYSVDYEDNAQHFVANTFQPNTDAHYIGLVQERYNTVHRNCVISQEELLEALSEATLARDLPGMADIDSSLLIFGKKIRQDFTIGLSGEGADEVFGGYPWFYREDLAEGSHFPWMRSTNLRSELLNDDWRKKLKLSEFVKNCYDEAIVEAPLLEGESKEESSKRQLFYLCMMYFMATLIDRKDRMTMAAGLEARLPFADHRLVEYAWNIPWHMKMSDGREKGILRDAVRDLLPREIAERKKSPYPKTHHPFYTKMVQAQLEGIVSGGDTVLRELFAKKKLDELVSSGGEAFKLPWFGQLMTGPQLLAYLIQLHQWFEQKRVRIVD